MHVVGIIAEYNPFHNGHLHHLNQIKALFPDSLIVLVLNGYFLERGEISCLSKEDKTRIALTYGVNLVLELPAVFGGQSADVFAEKAIEILAHFHVTDLVFGSECNHVTKIIHAAKEQLQEHYNIQVNEFLKKGYNYPTSMAKALTYSIQEPNDLLGLSYAKAILKQNLSIQIHTIKRTSSYHDTTSCSNIISATNIRKKWQQNLSIADYVPNGVFSHLNELDQQKFWKTLQYRIISDNSLEQFLTVDEGIEKRLQKFALNASSFEQFMQLIKTKRYTYNRLRRMCNHILLGFTKEQNSTLALCYVRILGFDLKGQYYLKQIRNDLQIETHPIVNSTQYQMEMRASFLYDYFTGSNTYDFERKNQPIQL